MPKILEEIMWLTLAIHWVTELCQDDPVMVREFSELANNKILRYQKAMGRMK